MSSAAPCSSCAFLGCGRTAWGLLMRLADSPRVCLASAAPSDWASFGASFGDPVPTIWASLGQRLRVREDLWAVQYCGIILGWGPHRFSCPPHPFGVVRGPFLRKPTCPQFWRWLNMNKNHIQKRNRWSLHRISWQESSKNPWDCRTQSEHSDDIRKGTELAESKPHIHEWGLPPPHWASPDPQGFVGIFLEPCCHFWAGFFWATGIHKLDIHLEP